MIWMYAFCIYSSDVWVYLLRIIDNKERWPVPRWLLYNQSWHNASIAVFYDIQHRYLYHTYLHRDNYLPRIHCYNTRAMMSCVSVYLRLLSIPRGSVGGEWCMGFVYFGSGSINPTPHISISSSHPYFPNLRTLTPSTKWQSGNRMPVML